MFLVVYHAHMKGQWRPLVAIDTETQWEIICNICTSLKPQLQLNIY